MKKVEAIVQEHKLNEIVKAIRKVGVGGLSVGKCDGQGADEPPLVSDYRTKNWIVTVVEDDKVSAIMSAIADVGCTNSKGDGKIFITNVEESMDICTKEKGIYTL